MNLPLINVFSEIYEAWHTRNPTLDEMLQHQRETGRMLHFVNESLIAKVADSLDAGKYICHVGADNGLGNFINSALDESLQFREWKRAMPSKTPQALSKYQKEFPNYDPKSVDFEINQISHCLSEGQTLFHGGIWPGGICTQYKTTLPFSTSFCPQVALRNAEHRGKAYDSSRIDLLVLRATSPKTNVFCFKRSGTNLGHENEVLFASGACLSLRNTHLIRNDYSACNMQMATKKIEIYVIEVDVS